MPQSNEYLQLTFVAEDGTSTQLIGIWYVKFTSKKINKSIIRNNKT